MVSSADQDLVYNLRLSSVGPARVTGEVTHEPSGMDLAMKLHYLQVVYFFSSQASQGLTIKRFKESSFYWLCEYYMVCGRFRRSDSGRPNIKCNDCGLRIIEAQCDKTVDEWLETKDMSVSNKMLVYHLPIGPDLCFSPTVYIQFTNFKCGGMSLGLSWAHVLGDPFSASEFMNVWGQFLSGLKTNEPSNITTQPINFDKPKNPAHMAKEPQCLKRVDPVGDHWVTPNNCKMETFSFRLTAPQVSHLHSSVRAQSETAKIPFFESFCAIMWQCIAKVKEDLGSEARKVTLHRKDQTHPRNKILSNDQMNITSVQVDFSVAGSNLTKLATLLANQSADEKTQIQETVERENGVSDYIVYGANLAFVDLEHVDFYGFEWNGHKPEYVCCSIQGVGDEGAVLVLPWLKESDKNGNHGRVVTVILPENEVVKLKFELEKNGMLVERDLE